MASMKYVGNIRTAPVWLADFIGRDEMSMFPAKIVASTVTDGMGVKVALTASANQSATSIACTALTLATYANTTVLSTGAVVIPVGAVLYFGSTKFARVTTAAVVGDTSIAVEALPTALLGTETAVYSPFNTSLLRSGTLVGRTFAQRTAETGFSVVTPSDVFTYDELGLVAFDCPNVQIDQNIEILRPGKAIAIKENYLPDYAANVLIADVQTITMADTSAGTFTVGYRGAWTPPLAYNVSTANLQTAIRALATVGGAFITVGGSAGTSYTLTWASTFIAKESAMFEVNAAAATNVSASRVARTTQNLIPVLRSMYHCITGKN